MATIITAD